MEDLQSALQSILSDPEQMARIQEIAGSLGMNPPEPPTSAAPPQEGQLSGRAGVTTSLSCSARDLFSSTVGIIMFAL